MGADRSTPDTQAPPWGMIGRVEKRSNRVEVVEYTDPICSWAWGTEPKLRLLRWRHGHRCDWRTVMGGLVGDSSRGRAGWDPVRSAAPMSDYWRRTTGYTGQPFPLPMHRTVRSTDPAGRAVKAAARQGDAVAERVLRRFRESIFLFGFGPETPEHFAAAARLVEGLDIGRWLTELDHPETIAAYRADWEETRRPNEYVRNLIGTRPGIGSMKHSDGHDRYAFPTLVFRGSGGEHTVPGWMPIDAYVDAMEAACPGLTEDPRPDPTPADAFARWGVLTERELAFICGPLARPPAGVTAYNWGEGIAYFTPEEAAASTVGRLPRTPCVSEEGLAAFGALQYAFDVAGGVVAAIGPDEWSRRTPCADWDVRALVNHMVGGARMVTFGLLGRAIGPDFYGTHLGPDPVAAYGEATHEAIGAFRADLGVLDRILPLPWGDTSGARLAEMFMGDHLVHAWDVARATGQPTTFDPELVARARVLSLEYVGEVRRGPEMFDAARPAPADAPPMDQLAAYLGRDLGGP